MYVSEQGSHLNDFLSRFPQLGARIDIDRRGWVRILLQAETRVAVLKRPVRRRFLVALLSSALGVILATRPAFAQAITFERDVLPILTANCLSCHGGTSIYTQAGLDLRTINSV